jgi:hypothetical protein
MSTFLFTSVIASGPVDWKQPMTAKGQPDISEMFVVETDNEYRICGEWSGPSASLLNIYSNAIGSGSVAVGHSIQYAYGHVRAAMIASGIDPRDGRTRTLCTMLGLASAGAKRGGRNGWPTFDEACDHFGITRAGVETAEDNCRCLLAVFRGMERAGIAVEPKIWRDRNA